MLADVATLLPRIPADVLGVCKRLRERGHRGWVVGGCVRDLLRGAPAKDWDVATDARPEEVVASFRRVIPTGIQHGTVTVMIQGTGYEVTTLRGEGAYTDGRRPDSVEFVDDITKDLARRDFTFNAMAIDPIDGHLVDPFGGAKDLEASVVRAVGEAEERFAEDGLRVLRAARFAATLRCSIDDATKRAMASNRALSTFKKVSAERVRDEWMKSMRAPAPSVAFDVMREVGVLAITCPELMESVGCTQNKWHAFDVWGHAMATLDACKDDPVLRVAALFHDVGKPRTRAFSEDKKDYTFYEHERVGAEMAEPILARLRFSNAERAKVVALVRHHLITYDESWGDAAVRRWLRRVTPELAPDLYEIGFADARGKGRPCEEDIARVKALCVRADAMLAAGAALTARALAIDGKVLMSELGLAPGRVIGKLLERLVDAVTEEPSLNERERLLAEARRILPELATADQPGGGPT